MRISSRFSWAFPALALCLVWGPIAPAGAADSSREAPEFNFFEVQTPTCYRARELSQICHVEWSYFYVEAGAAQYLLRLRVEIGGRVRANFQGFFQTVMYVPAEMYSPGFAVTCGQPGAGGDPRLGNQHSWVVRAEETGGGIATNSGAIFCPATLYIFTDGFESANTSAWSASFP